MKRQSIRYRFHRELLLFGLVLLLGGGSGVISAYFWGMEDATKLSFLIAAEDAEAGRQLTGGERDGDRLRVWIGLDSVPAEVLALFPSASHVDDELLMRYVYDESESSGKLRQQFVPNLLTARPQRIHMFLRHPTADGRQIYLVHSASPADYYHQTRQRTLLWLIALTLLAALLLMVLLARRLAAVVLTPLAALTAMAAKVDEQAPGRHDDITDQRNEIGKVARVLQRSLSRIHDFHQREKRFLRSASHELRTPIAVISSALDVVDQRRANGLSDFGRPLADIRRAAEDMRELTEALLWLARAEGHGIGKSRVRVAPLLESLIDAHRPLLADECLQVRAEVSAEAELDIEQPFLKIILSNLLRNAFEHGGSGTVAIGYANRVFEIRNPADVAAQRSGEGFGLGMPIVEEVAQKLGWRLSVDAADSTVLARLCLPT